MNDMKSYTHNPLSVISGLWPEASVDHIKFDKSLKSEVADFDMREASTHDGTLLFTVELFSKLLIGIVNETVGSKENPPDENKTLVNVRYRVGNIIHTSENAHGRLPLLEIITIPVCVEYIYNEKQRNGGDKMTDTAKQIKTDLIGPHDFVQTSPCGRGENHPHGLIGRLWRIGDPESIAIGDCFMEGRIKSGDLFIGLHHGGDCFQYYGYVAEYDNCLIPKFKYDFGAYGIGDAVEVKLTEEELSALMRGEWVKGEGFYHLSGTNEKEETK